MPRLRRVVRQAAGELGKHVQLKLDGAQGELDRNVLERMTAPLEHMLRNAVAHGLETPDKRRKAQQAGRGHDPHRGASRRFGSRAGSRRRRRRPRPRRDPPRGEERGLVRADAVLSDADLDALILEPGFSTADTVSRLSGRGVGMDVVASEVRQLGGTLDINSSRRARASTFTLRLPQTLAVTQAVFVRIGETTFAVPIASVRGVGRIARDRLDMADAHLPLRRRGLRGPRSGRAGRPRHRPRPKASLQMPLLLIRSGDLRAAVCVDQVVGNREIVVKPVGPQVGFGAGHLRRDHHG